MEILGKAGSAAKVILGHVVNPTPGGFCILGRGLQVVPPTTVEIQRIIASGADDVTRRRTPSGWFTTSLAMIVGAYNSTNYAYGVGLRFLNMTIPPGATIVSAKVSLQNYRPSANEGQHTYIRAEASDNAAAFTDASNFDARVMTSARVDWSHDTAPSLGVWIANQTYETPDLATVVQEVVSRPGWASGNSIVVFWDDFDNRSANPLTDVHSMISYDGAGITKLMITYTV